MLNQTAVYKPAGFKRGGLQMVIFLTLACFISVLYYILMSQITFANLLYQFANYLYLCVMGLVIAFCCVNIKIKSKLSRSALFLIGTASVLLGINMVQYMNGSGDAPDPDRFYLNLLLQYNLFRVVFFLGFVLLFFSLTRVITLTGRQKVFRALGMTWILLYLLWICFFRFPNDALLSFSYGPEGILGSYAQACYNIYRPVAWILDNHFNLNIVGLTSDVILSIISILFLKTKALIEDEGGIVSRSPLL